VAAPLFFLSYARADDDGYIAKFYRDFVAEVQRQSGQRREDVGFRDLSTMQAGSLWRDELNEAIGRASTFIALCSPTYYTSEYCGKEWSAYRARLDRHRIAAGIYPATLIPVIWVPSARAPEAVLEVQYTHDELGELYAREGLHFLLRLSRYRDEYNEVVIRLARRIVALAEQFDLPESSEPVDLDVVPSAFLQVPPSSAGHGVNSATPSTTGTSQETGTGSGTGTSSHTGTSSDPGTPRGTGAAPVGGGPRHVSFVVAAATSEDMVRFRQNLHHYGQDSFAWSPYKPELDQRICVFAQQVAAVQNLSSGLARADEIEALLDHASEANEIVVLLVDAWATKLEEYRDPLRTYDRRNEPTSPVMVPWSSSDVEIFERRDELRADLHRTFPRNFARGDALMRPEVTSSEAFEAELTGALVEAQSRVFRFGRVVRRAGGDSVTERPIL
jgi:FxsC-like protein